MSDTPDNPEQPKTEANQDIPASVELISGQELSLWGHAIQYVEGIDLEAIELETNLYPVDKWHRKNLKLLSKAMYSETKKKVLLPPRHSAAWKRVKLSEHNKKFRKLFQLVQTVGERHLFQQTVIDSLSDHVENFNRDVQSAIDGGDLIEIDKMFRRQVVKCVVLNIARKYFWSVTM
ncbi:unnamed protein product [Caenorhabditis auriculariae]|uniref:Uncharacterized protein n=1 Tax=Caenorhabditis auriculariae TaxID=2777116 RepID=A0A8S1H414_9PELO|nr:unnamed protein product [Caenorhabditis auriculariae]